MRIVDDLLLRVAARASRRSTGSILGLHGLREQHLPTAGIMHLLPHHLDQLLATCETLGTVVPLPELLDRWKAGRSTAGMIALTFDDAYLSVEALATPRLRRLPRTYFAVSDRLGATFWWDRLEELLPHTTTERWRRFEDEVGVPEGFRQGQPQGMGLLRPLRQWILARHRGLDPPSLEQLLSELEEELGIRSTQRSMSADELAVAARDPLVTVGLHTTTHRVLPLLNAADVREDLVKCVAALREVVPDPIEVLAVPFGLYDDTTLSAASQAGVTTVLTLAPKSLPRKAALTAPRYCMTDREPEWKLAVKLSGALGWFQKNDEGPPPLPSEND